jgi:outer membrane protein assembly factor BamB
VNRTEPARRPARGAGSPAPRRAVAALVLLALAAAPAAAQEPEAEEEGVAITGFSIPNTRSAAARLERARGHLAAGRWNEAVEDLQELLETHRGELVQVEGRDEDGPPLFVGAGREARRLLGALGAEPLELYRRRHEARAEAALELARASGDRQAVVEVAERWPVTRAAGRAWWTLGDLELEVGHLAEARRAFARALARRLEEAGARTDGLLEDADDPGAWRRALAALESAGQPLDAAEGARTDLVLELLGEASPLPATAARAAAPGGSLRLAGPGEGAAGAPGPDASTWPRPFRLPPQRPFEHGASNLFPVRWDDLVFVSDSLQLFAVNAYSGELAWESELPAGWDELGSRRAEFFEGISREDTMIAPAAAQGVVVSAHQVPISDIRNETFRNISITTVIPDRRLYAYDAATGRELWNHAPAPDWDGESGDFVERTSVAGPPVVSASRVLVPVHRMYGRIEFHVACYDLVTGEVLWATQLVSGQRELNMFARAEREFSAPPVRVEGDRVVVLTQLGAVAALDLFSGEILWETLYDQITPPQRSHFQAQRLRNVWRNAPPVVADGVVVATPFDGRDLLGLDLETGETLWEVSSGWIEHVSGAGRGSAIDVLLGADEHTVFLGSWPVVALRSSGGLSREAPRELAWRHPADELELSEATSARGLVLADRVLVPTRDERVEVDRFGGRRSRRPAPWAGQRSGNLLAGDGALHVLSTRALDGYFEWDTLLARARRRAAEEGPGGAAELELAELLVERSRTELDAGRTGRARGWLDEAEALLAPEGGPAPESPARRSALHGLLRVRGRALADLADGAGARRALARARQLAPDAAALQDTLVQEYLLVRESDPAARLELLGLVERDCADGELAAAPEALPYGPLHWRFTPLSAEDPAPEEAPVWALSPTLWTTLERLQLAADGDDPGEELEALHRLLARWPDEPLPRSGGGLEPVAELARRRIGEVLERRGREVHAPFEARAAALLEDARRRGDRRLLERVPSLYPHSLAGRAANDDLLEWASRDGDVEAVAAIALSELPERWRLEDASAREVELLLHLAASVGEGPYARALLGALAAVAPGTPSPVPAHEGRTPRELVEALAPLAPAAPRPPARFDAAAAPLAAFPGSHSYLGVVPPAPGADPAPVLLYARRAGRSGEQVSLVAYASDALAAEEPRPLWEVALDGGALPVRWEEAVALVPGAVVALGDGGVFALDREDGTRFWERDWIADLGEVDSLVAGEGLVLVTVRVPGREDSLVALDWRRGREVWRAPLDPLALSRRPVVGPGCVVLMPRRSQQQGRILDLFTGRPRDGFELPARIHQSALEAAWIEDGRLVVPWFLTGRNPDRNRIVAVALLDGSLAWDLDLGEVQGGQRQLRSILQHDGRTYLVLVPVVGAELDEVRGVLAELDLRIGATRRLSGLELDHDLRFVGVPQEERVVLETPSVHLYSFAADTGELEVTAIDLRQGGPRWRRRLPLTRDDHYNAFTRLPAESQDAVALVFSSKGGTRFGRARSNLFLLDAASGRLLRQLLLDPRLGASNEIDLQGLGPALILAGDGQLEVLR